MKTTIRLAKPDEATQFTEWSLSTRQNGLDPDIANYPNLRTLTIELDGEPAIYVPIHPVLVIESVAVRPGLTPRQYITSLLQAKSTIEQIARGYGIAEIHTSSTYQPMIRTLARHGYEPIIGTALRKKV
jgi:hypothetical protein